MFGVLTWFPLMYQVILATGFERTEVQLASTISPNANDLLDNDILGGCSGNAGKRK